MHAQGHIGMIPPPAHGQARHRHELLQPDWPRLRALRCREPLRSGRGEWAGEGRDAALRGRLLPRGWAFSIDLYSIDP